MTAELLAGSDSPLMRRMFPPLPLVERMQHTPLMICGVLMCCLAVAFLARGGQREIIVSPARLACITCLLEPNSSCGTLEARSLTGQ
jgi:hypothetical protein